MTTGTYVKNELFTQTKVGRDCLGPTLWPNIVSGYYNSKSWSGQDSPPSAVQTFRLRKVSYTIMTKGGILRNRTRILKEKLGPIRPAKTENAYTCNFGEWNEVVISAQTSCPEPGKTQVSYFSSQNNCVTTDSEASVWTSNDSIELVGKLGNAVNGQTFNMAVFLGEGKEALETIARASTRIYKAYKQLRKGNLFRAFKTLVGGRAKERGFDRKYVTTVKGKPTQQWVADRWLELQYGWKPLLQDIYNAATHFAFMQNRPQVLTYRARLKRQVKKLTSASSSQTVWGSAFVAKTITARVSKIDELALLGLLDPLALAWEKLPFSFVFDWFIPLGNYLEAINLNRALTAKYITSSLYVKQTTGVSSNPSASARFTGNPSYRVGTARREVSSSLNIPLPQIKPWDKVLSWQHAANAVALLIGLTPSRHTAA